MREKKLKFSFLLEQIEILFFSYWTISNIPRYMGIHLLINSLSSFNLNRNNRPRQVTLILLFNLLVQLNRNR